MREPRGGAPSPFRILAYVQTQPARRRGSEMVLRTIAVELASLIEIPLTRRRQRYAQVVNYLKPNASAPSRDRLRLRDEQIEPQALGQELGDELTPDAVTGVVEGRGEGAQSTLAR